VASTPIHQEFHTPKLRAARQLGNVVMHRRLGNTWSSFTWFGNNLERIKDNGRS
jgi:hypothetical protein